MADWSPFAEMLPEGESASSTLSSVASLMISVAVSYTHLDVYKRQVEIIKVSQKREILLATRGPGEVFGEIALVFDSPRTATVRARTDTSMIGIGREDLRNLLQISPSAAASMFDIILSRWQNTQNLLRQSEKMAQLGTFTAGIAHELNNPAAAVQRSTEHLDTVLFDSAHTFMRLVRQGLSPEQQTTLEQFCLLYTSRCV